MITFATFGPKGTNHERVTKEYILFHEIENARIELVPNFDVATKGLLNGDFDFVVQCAVHPETPETMGAHFSKMFAVDSFISRSKELAILTRKDVKDPKTIGLLSPATESYIDPKKWETLIPGVSLPIIFDNLLNGAYDSALVYLEYAEQFPDRVRVDEVIGSPDDVWIVYARERTSGGNLQAFKDAPIRRLLTEKGARFRAEREAV
ncbi:MULTISPECIES: hypothetical protein [Rhizobium/Agrobacterium group]|uniref:hypothetical protein n=1 Tax=Rhizobium/Agrobacterium group TaxID=227290 RepID=UPI00107F232A|nr:MULTISPECIES: hypothetical protein [Rhizobium/Agrobacterium group]MBB4403148.1 hypothetical protein [Agrobacterium radiobacter]MBB5588942.1 hypothetical protein [Agrobacterium radiobacter]TGE86534.1 hypothetical protein C9418_22715 [Rhizobium sp. SEMIA 4032]